MVETSSLAPMTTPPRSTSAALSFAGVADAYERARPGYPHEAVAWLLAGEGGDHHPQRVVELGAGTGKLTHSLTGHGAGKRTVVATDPLGPMLRHLARTAPDAMAAFGTAEQIPVRRRWADVVVGAQAFHWFDQDRALPEIARVLRPGGRIALAWNVRDERIPWVKRLGRLIGTPEQHTDPTLDLLATGLFGFVEQAQFRFWQPLDRDRLHDLVTSRSNVASMDDAQRQQVLADVDELYDGYGRGADGMLLPYVTHCFRAVARASADPDDDGDGLVDPPTDDDSDNLLIDFR
jgi:ubiquinone/menaquinone biosynthesis C-methylase UbiE